MADPKHLTPTTEEPAQRPELVRLHRHRRRRRAGIRILQVQVLETEIAILLQAGKLQPSQWRNGTAVAQAIEAIVAAAIRAIGERL